MVMIQVLPETLLSVAEGSVIIPSRGIVDTIDEGHAAYIVGMGHAKYYEEAGPPVNTVQPALDKLAASPGDVVTCSSGTWTGAEPLEYFYKWDADGVDIPSAVTAQHTVTLADLDKALACRVRAVDPYGRKLLVECEAPCLVSAAGGGGRAVKERK